MTDRKIWRENSSSQNNCIYNYLYFIFTPHWEHSMKTHFQLYNAKQFHTANNPLFVLAFLLVLLPTWVSAQITGRVVDTAGNTLEGVQISALHDGTETTSGADGSFSLELLEDQVGIRGQDFLGRNGLPAPGSHLQMNLYSGQLEVHAQGGVFDLQGTFLRVAESAGVYRYGEKGALRKALAQADTLVFVKAGYVTVRVEITDDAVDLGDVVLDAKVPETFSITYHLDGGVNSVSNPTSFTSETETILLENPTKVGHSFGGWFDNAEKTGAAISQIPVGSSGNLQYWAKWDVVLYTLTYHLNGGTGEVPEAQEVAYATSLVHPAQPVLQGANIRDGISQRFLGWKTQADGSGFVAQGAMPPMDYHLYAIWTEDDDVLGKIGPAGGIIFYERPESELTPGYEWRYLEAAPSEGTTEVNWARTNTSVSTQLSIGAGYTNSQNLHTTLGSDAYAYARARYPSYSSTYLGQVTADFYLPSLMELEEMYKFRVLLNGVATNKYYWSSSESSHTESNGVKSKAYRIWMGTGAPSDHPKNSSLYSNVTRARVRAIRRF
jgi:uncharacterized repeat protein (TIGR02543 family)